VSRTIYRSEGEWHVPIAPGTDPEAAAEAGRQGAARRFLAQGDQGFYAQIVRMPPGFEAPVHSHDHEEVFMVLEGDCTFDGEPMNRFDMTVVAADEPYGFVAGADGLSFLVVRNGAAAFSTSESGKEVAS
jgi:mannose-6-phosphate isomerase-like protein (cupin superfamily)